MAAIYLTFEKFKAATTMPEEFVDEVENRYPGWVEGQLAFYSRWIEARLRKRYQTPFAAHDVLPVEEATPPQIQIWLAQIVAPEVWLKRGVDLNDAQFEKIVERGDTAREEILEAATSDESWFDLPAKTDEDGSLIQHPTPKFYSEQSPYVFTDVRRERAIIEDESGTGTSG